MRRVCALIASVLLASSALASEPIASLTAQEGNVLVNTGEEFVTAADAQALNAGDRIMVMESSLAEVTFADGCVLALEAGTLVALPALSPCETGEVASVQRIGPSYAQAVGSPAVEREERKRRAAWIFGGTGVAIVAALLIDDYSISP